MLNSHIYVSVININMVVAWEKGTMLRAATGNVYTRLKAKSRYFITNEQEKDYNYW